MIGELAVNISKQNQKVVHGLPPAGVHVFLHHRKDNCTINNYVAGCIHFFAYFLPDLHLITREYAASFWDTLIRCNLSVCRPSSFRQRGQCPCTTYQCGYTGNIWVEFGARLKCWLFEIWFIVSFLNYTNNAFVRFRCK